MNDLGMDSLDTVEVVMAFEDEFGKTTDCLMVESNLYLSQNNFCLHPQAWRFQTKKLRRYSRVTMP